MAADDKKIVRCCHCRGVMRVPARAFSVFCPHCQKRAPLESLRIVGSHPGKALATCGDIFIESSARLNLSVTANNVVVHGRVRGPVVAAQTVQVGPTGQVIGDITAEKIIVSDGALIDGNCVMIRPRPIPSKPAADDGSAPDMKAPDREGRPHSEELDAAPSSPITPPPAPLPPPKKSFPFKPK